MTPCDSCALVEGCALDKKFPCPFMGEVELKDEHIKRLEYKESIVAKVFGVDLFARVCSSCGKEFNEGILDERDSKTYCSYKCAAEDMTAEELSYGIIDDELFYTEWDESDCDDADTPPDEEPEDDPCDEEQAELDSVAEDNYFGKD